MRPFTNGFVGFWLFGLAAAFAAGAPAARAQAGPEAGGLRLIETAPGERSWMTEAQIIELSERAHAAGHCGGFMDVTEHPAKRRLYLEPLEAFGPLGFDGLQPSHPSLVEPLLPQLTPAGLLASVAALEAFHNRYYKSDTGAAAAEWVRDRFQQLAAGRSDVTVELVRHGFAQPSVVARIAGHGPAADEVVVLGGHLDSVNWQGAGSVDKRRAPGADDNASGTATVLEIFGALAKGGYRPSRTLEFMAYAGEELGLLGSQDIAESYQKAGRKVIAVMQFDMTMFPGKGGKLSFITDHVHSGLTKFTQRLLDAYVKLPWQESRCGYACSDHASWTEAGFPAVFPFEAKDKDYNRDIHTPKDVSAILSSAFGLQFAQLGLAFAVELTAGGNP